jgi:hypothetical protein
MNGRNLERRRDNVYRENKFRGHAYEKEEKLNLYK